ncbi:hypothetical protein MMC25_006602 [Agyrium rufum]|nr:hypothetical protein [Agyrium rufum]
MSSKPDVLLSPSSPASSSSPSDLISNPNSAALNVPKSTPTRTQIPTINLKIAPSLQHLDVSLPEYYATHPETDALIIGACIFLPPLEPISNFPNPNPDASFPASTATSSSPRHMPMLSSSSLSPPPSSSSSSSSSATLSNPPAGNPTPKILLVQRASTETGFPNKWEVPGGSAEVSDGSIFATVARETLEETGLHVTKIVREVGPEGAGERGRKFMIRTKRCVKRTFEVRVREIESLKRSTGTDSTTRSIQQSDVPVILDPLEHQRYAWIDEKHILNPKAYSPQLSFATEEQRQDMLEAFKRHRLGH